MATAGESVPGSSEQPDYSLANLFALKTFKPCSQGISETTPLHMADAIMLQSSGNRTVIQNIPTMLPKTLALIDDDREYTEFLSQHLKEHGVDVSVFPDSNDLLTEERAFAFDFYVIDLMLPGVHGVELIKLIRRRSDVGLLVVSGQLAPDVFSQVVSAGADMYLAKPVLFEQVITSIQAVQRRVQPANPADAPWSLDRRARQLIAPDGAVIDLSDIDMAVMNCLHVAKGATVTRETLCNALGRMPDGNATDGLNSIIFRLRRRIERATTLTAPLQSKPRVGYLFKAPLKII